MMEKYIFFGEAEQAKQEWPGSLTLAGEHLYPLLTSCLA
jgi:hypothetical protein